MTVSLIVFIAFVVMVVCGGCMVLAVVTWLFWKDEWLKRRSTDKTQHHTHDHYYHVARPETQPEREPSRIERQPHYDVIAPDTKRIEKQSNRVYLPAARERLALPSNH